MWIRPKNGDQLSSAHVLCVKYTYGYTMFHVYIWRNVHVRTKILNGAFVTRLAGSRRSQFIYHSFEFYLRVNKCCLMADAYL